MSKNNFTELLINPFNKIAGTKALLIGLALFITTIIIAQLHHIVFIGVISIKLSNQPLSNALIFGLSGLLLFIVLLYIIGRLLSKSSIRIIDIAGTLSLAKAPLLLIVLIYTIPLVMKGTIEVTSSLLSSTHTSLPSPENYVFFGIFIIVILISSIWMLVLSYNAFNVSCNVKGIKSIVSFIAAIVLAEIFSYLIVVQLIGINSLIPTNNLSTNRIEIISERDYTQVNSIAIETAQDLKNKSYNKVYERFDAAMQKALPETALEKTMVQIESQLGKLLSTETDIQNSSSGEYKISLVPCVFEKQKAHLQFTFNKSNQISGFYIKP